MVGPLNLGGTLTQKDVSPLWKHIDTHCNMYCDLNLNELLYHGCFEYVDKRVTIVLYSSTLNKCDGENYFDLWKHQNDSLD